MTALEERESIILETIENHSHELAEKEYLDLRKELKNIAQLKTFS